MNNINDMQFLALVASRISKISNLIYEYFQTFSNKTANKHANDCNIRMY